MSTEKPETASQVLGRILRKRQSQQSQSTSSEEASGGKK